MARQVEQLSLELDWGREPWAGRSPRTLTRGFLRVDNYDRKMQGREAEAFVDAAQWTMFLQGTPSRQVSARHSR